LAPVASVWAQSSVGYALAKSGGLWLFFLAAKSKNIGRSVSIEHDFDTAYCMKACLMILLIKGIASDHQGCEQNTGELVLDVSHAWQCTIPTPFNCVDTALVQTITVVL
jgi:hypothetical protein